MELLANPLTKLVTGRNRVNEDKARYIIRQICLAINFIHSRGIVHRDLKPDNILLQDMVPDDPEKPRVKVSDFGFATSFQDNPESLKLRLGTPNYMAPEIINPNIRNHTKLVDIWAIGCITYWLFLGNLAFDANSTKELYRKILHHEPDYRRLNGIASPAAQDFIKQCLVKDPLKRPSAKMLLDHDWTKMVHSVVLEESISQAMENLTHAPTRDDFQASVASYITKMLINNQELVELRKVFEGADLDNDGTLSREELKYSMDAIKDILQIEEENLEEIFKTVDVDGSDSIDFQEFTQAALDARILLRDENLEKAFNAFDTDGDGGIDAEELKLVFDNSVSDFDDERWATITAKIDTNGDGKIQFEEFEAYMKSLVRDEFQQNSLNSLDKEESKQVQEDENI